MTRRECCDVTENAVEYDFKSFFQWQALSNTLLLCSKPFLRRSRKGKELKKNKTSDLFILFAKMLLSVILQHC